MSDNGHRTPPPPRGMWGVFRDGRSRVSRTAKAIEQNELAPEYPAVSPLAKRRRQMAARYLALVLKAMDEGNERKTCVMQKAAESQLGKLRRLGEGNGHGQAQDLASLVLEAHRNTPR